MVLLLRGHRLLLMVMVQLLLQFLGGGGRRLRLRRGADGLRHEGTRGPQHCCHLRRRRRFEQKNVLTIKFSSFVIAAPQQREAVDPRAPAPVRQPHLQSGPAAEADPRRPKENRQDDLRRLLDSCARCAH